MGNMGNMGSVYAPTYERDAVYRNTRTHMSRVQLAPEALPIPHVSL